MPETPQASTDRPTVEQANAALTELMRRPDSEVIEPAPAPASVEEPAPTPATGGNEVSVTSEESPAADPAPDPPNDDVVSLRQRLADRETELTVARADSEARLKAAQERAAVNERILRDKFLRKASETDRALKILKAARSGANVTESEADQVIQQIESGMNPASASYTPAPPQSPATLEDQTLALNAFLNEKGMTMDEAKEFGDWMKSTAGTVLSPLEQAVAERDIDGFLRLAHTRWREGASAAQQEKTRADAVAAAKVVQRTQRAAAAAATTVPSAPRKQTQGPRPTAVDPKKLSKDDVSRLFKQSIEEAKNS